MPCQAASAVRIVARRQKNVRRVQPAEQPLNRATPNPSRSRISRAGCALAKHHAGCTTNSGHRHHGRRPATIIRRAAPERLAEGHHRKVLLVALVPVPGSICAYATLFQLTSCAIKARSRLPRPMCQAIAWATRDRILSGIIRAWPISQLSIRPMRPPPNSWSFSTKSLRRSNAITPRSCCATTTRTTSLNVISTPVQEPTDPPF